MKRYVLLAISIGCLLLATPVWAFSGGVSSASFGPSGCNGCHSGGNDPLVELIGPEFVLPGTAHEFTLVIHSPEDTPQTYGGLNINAADGALTTGGEFSAQTMIIGGGPRDEITHQGGAKPGDRGRVMFSFLWTAPAMSFSSVTLNGWGNAVNDANGNMGDRASLATLAVQNGDLGLCAATPVACSTPSKSQLAITDSTDDSKDAVSFQWNKGPAVTASEFGDPTVNTDYALCIYENSALILSLYVPAATDCGGKPCWKASGDPLAPKGYKYRNKGATPSGVQSVKLSAGIAGKSKAQVKAKGVELPDPAALPLTGSTITAQLVNGINSTCLGDEYNGAEIVKDDGEKFKAKAATP